HHHMAGAAGRPTHGAWDDGQGVDVPEIHAHAGSAARGDLGPFAIFRHARIVDRPAVIPLIRSRRPPLATDLARLRVEPPTAACAVVDIHMRIQILNVSADIGEETLVIRGDGDSCPAGRDSGQARCDVVDHAFLAAGEPILHDLMGVGALQSVDDIRIEKAERRFAAKTEPEATGWIASVARSGRRHTPWIEVEGNLLAAVTRDTKPGAGGVPRAV